MHFMTHVGEPGSADERWIDGTPPRLHTRACRPRRLTERVACACVQCSATARFTCSRETTCWTGCTAWECPCVPTAAPVEELRATFLGYTSLMCRTHAVSSASLMGRCVVRNGRPACASPLLTLSGAGQADAARVLQPTPGASVLLRVCRNMVNVYSEVYTQPADKKYLLQVRLPMHYHASMRRTQGGACSLTPSHPSHPLGHHHRC